MSLQGPLLVVAEQPASDIVEALQVAGAFPVVTARWADAPTAFVSIKPSAVVIAETTPPPSEMIGRMFCIQIATAPGPIVPVLARIEHGSMLPIPIALSVDANAPPARLAAQIETCQRVRELHAAVLRRIETFVAHGGEQVHLPLGDALEDATVVIAGRANLFPALSAAFGPRLRVVGASLDTALRHLKARDVDGFVIGDGFSQRQLDGFLNGLAQDPACRNMPVMIAADIAADLAGLFRRSCARQETLRASLNA